MIEPTVLESRQERALLVSVDTGDFDAAASLQELYELTRSAGAEPVFSVTQKREKPDVATCIGTGRLEEIREFCRNHEIDLLVFDCELSPIQIRNLEAETDIRVVDRTMLILDIFASRARTAEGKLQVELAQLQYMLPRLTGKGVALSRLGGGIGTRGLEKPNWKQTAAISDAGSKASASSLPAWNSTGISCAAAGKRTAFSQ